MAGRHGNKGVVSRVLPQMAADGFHRQKMTSATASQPTPDRPSWFHTQPAMPVM